jgi:hypothetical protein
LKPWKKFSEYSAVFKHFAKVFKNVYEKVPFLLARFLWAIKENEHKTK